MLAFPKDLSRFVHKTWRQGIIGDYEFPPCPPVEQLQSLFETAYLAASSPEESRYPAFNIIAVPTTKKVDRFNGSISEFTVPRQLTVSEIRRLAPAVDLKKSAILAEWGISGWSITGLVDFGTSWHRARAGFGYAYKPRESLLLQIDRPGRMRVYQGLYFVAELNDGNIVGRNESEYYLFLHETTNNALENLSKGLDRPAYESPREFLNFEFIALWNSYAALANAISLLGHGGMLIISEDNMRDIQKNIRLKYSIKSNSLKKSFVSFLNARHKIADLSSLWDDGHYMPKNFVYRAEFEARERYEELVEETRFVAGLSGCDGSIVISNDLELIGFGGEIKAETSSGAEVFEVENEMQRKYKQCDVEQFGMRHRSAIKRASQLASCRSLVISQDGPISGVWQTKGKVYVKKGLNLANMNMPLS